METTNTGITFFDEFYLKPTSVSFIDEEGLYNGKERYIMTQYIAIKEVYDSALIIPCFGIWNVEELKDHFGEDTHKEVRKAHIKFMPKDKIFRVEAIMISETDSRITGSTIQTINDSIKKIRNDWKESNDKTKIEDLFKLDVQLNNIYDENKGTDVMNMRILSEVKRINSLLEGLNLKNETLKGLVE